MLAYYSNIIINRVESDAHLMRGYIIVDLDKIEFTVMVVMKFLCDARDGEHLGVPSHERRPGCGTLVPLPKGVVNVLDQLGIFHLVRASSFDAACWYGEINLSCSI